MSESFTWVNTFILLLMLLPKSGSDNDRSLFGQQSFRGKIVYSVIYESKSPFISVEDLERAYGTEAVMYIQGDNYKMTYNGDYTHSMLYIGKENKQLVTFTSRDSMMWRDCNQYDSYLLRMYTAPKRTVILGRSCDEFMIETDWGVTRYYYDPHMYLKPKGFRNHGFDYFNVYLRHARAPYLKCEYDGPSFKRTLIAVDIQETDVSREVFSPLNPVALSRKP